MSKKGFTLVEVLLSLSITLLIVLNCSLLVKVLKISNQSKYIDTSLENAIFSLSNELITAKNIEYGDSLSFLDENDDSNIDFSNEEKYKVASLDEGELGNAQIILQNKRLVITPGHHILYHDIDSVYFENTNGFIKINLMSNNKEYQFIVGSDYEKKEELLKARLVAVYESGETSYLDVLLGSESLIDLISNYYLVSEIVISDEELLEEIQKQKENIENSKHDLEVSQEEMNTSKEQKQNVSEELQKSKTEKNTYVAKLSNDEKEIQEQIEDLNQANKSIDDKITAIIASSNNTSSNNNSNNGNINVNVNGSSSAGFIKPVNSYVTTGMYYSSGQYHGAVDYGAAGINGLPVYAVGDGEVILAEALTTSYGNYIIIAHYNGLYTLYAHGQDGSRKVSAGQTVKKGQQIMNVGSTGNSTGPHLHFEVRKSSGTNKDTIDPAPYLFGEKER